MSTIFHYKHLQTTIYHTMDLSTDMVHVTAIKKGNINTIPLCTIDSVAVLYDNNNSVVGSFHITDDHWWFTSKDKEVNIQCEHTSGGESLLQSEKTIVLHYLNKEGSWMNKLTQS